MRLPISQSPPAATQYRLFVDIIAQENILGFTTSKEKVKHNLAVFNLINAQPRIDTVSKTDANERHQFYTINDFLLLYKHNANTDKGYMIIANFKVDVTSFFLESFIGDEFSKEMYIHWDRARLELLRSFQPEDYEIMLCLPTLGNVSHLQRMYR